MAETTTRLGLPLIAADQALKHVTHNEALAMLDGMVQLAVEAVDATAPPGSPAEGAIWALGTGATGAWAGRDGQLAIWTAGGWRFAVPGEGWMIWTKPGDALLVHDGSGWTGYAPGFSAMHNLTHLGVRTTADDTNRLAVASEAVLLTHAPGGADSRVKVNKAAAGDTASHLFQTGFSGRAEFGLTGDDDFRIKVSPDGAAWHEAIAIDRATGMVRLPSGTDDTFHDLAAGSISGGMLQIPAYGGHFRLTGHGAAHVQIEDFGNLRPVGKAFSLWVPRTVALTGGAANALGNRVRFVHTASGPGLDLSMNRRMVSGSPVLTYDAYPNANEATGAAAALHELLWFVPEGGGRHRLTGLPGEAVVETGTQRVVRHPSGLQVIDGISPEVYLTDQANAAIFRSNALAFDFAAAFTAAPRVSSAAVGGAGTSQYAWFRAHPSGHTATLLRGALGGVANTNSSYIEFIARGRWKP